MEIARIEGYDKQARRESKWVGIIIHHTGIGGRTNIDASLWATLFTNITSYLSKKDDNYVSSNFIISRDGKVVQLVDPDKYESYHAGVSSWWHPRKNDKVSDWNRYAIGIELLGDGNIEKYSDAQYASLAELCRELMAKYPTIHPCCVVGHQMLTSRKVDPGNYFDWKRFYRDLYSTKTAAIGDVKDKEEMVVMPPKTALPLICRKTMCKCEEGKCEREVSTV
jgi:N-acetyl-anhydromuramoyl-L-alanine amidase